MAVIAVAESAPVLRLAMNQAVSSRIASARKKIHLGSLGDGEEDIMGRRGCGKVCAPQGATFQLRSGGEVGGFYFASGRRQVVVGRANEFCPFSAH